MIGRADDILQLITQANTQPLTNNMGNPSSPSNYGQGQILTWNPATFENQVSYRNGVLTNVPVLSGPDALTYQEGDIVAILSNAPNNGATVYWIGGRIIVPGPGRGAEAIAFLTGELGRAISASVFADRIKDDTVLASENNAPAAFGDLATVGPTVQEVEVGPAGKLIVFATAQIGTPAAGFTRAFMSYDVIGPTTSLANSLRGMQLGAATAAGGGVDSQFSQVSVLSGLDQGIYTVQARYQTAGATATTFYSNRRLITISF